MVARVLGSSILSAWHTKNMWQVRSRAKIAKKKKPKTLFDFPKATAQLSSPPESVSG